jgi:molecular chaperone DnaJ
MAQAQDPYQVLGVARGATEEEIRSAYRKLARKHHPDLNPGNKTAEQRFKEIAAAHGILSDPARRKLYDEHGADGLRQGFDPEEGRAYRRWSQAPRPGGGDGEVPFEFDLEDILGGLGGSRGSGGFDRAQGGRSGGFRLPGRDIVAEVELDFVQALRGTEVELRVPGRSPCSACAGTGVQPGTAVADCPDCGGSGRRQVVGGPMAIRATCDRCGGSGKRHTPCASCRGEGTVPADQKLRIRIPPGADNGGELRVPGRGTPGSGGGPPGDLLVRTRVRPHRHFRREGLDLTLHLPVTLAEAYHGATVDVPTPEGPVQMKVPPRSSSGLRLRVRGKGVEKDGRRGDLYVDLEVRTPEREDQRLGEALREAEQLYPRPVREGIEL